VPTFYILHCSIGLKIAKINIDTISQKCSVHNTGRKGILLPIGEVPGHIRQEDETVVVLPPLHEWTPCEGWCNGSRSRVRLSKQGAIFVQVVSHLIRSCDGFDQWDATGEDSCQSGITLFLCGNYLSVLCWCIKYVPFGYVLSSLYVAAANALPFLASQLI